MSLPIHLDTFGHAVGFGWREFERNIATLCNASFVANSKPFPSIKGSLSGNKLSEAQNWAPFHPLIESWARVRTQLHNTHTHVYIRKTLTSNKWEQATILWVNLVEFGSILSLFFTKLEQR